MWLLKQSIIFIANTHHVSGLACNCHLKREINMSLERNFSSLTKLNFQFNIKFITKSELYLLPLSQLLKMYKPHAPFGSKYNVYAPICLYIQL